MAFIDKEPSEDVRGSGAWSEPEEGSGGLGWSSRVPPLAGGTGDPKEAGGKAICTSTIHRGLP